MIEAEIDDSWRTFDAAWQANHQYRAGDAFMFGPETRGLPQSTLETASPDHRLFIPMRAESRSINLSNAVALVLFEAWRQVGFAGSLP